jgi:hypothetical protein
MQFFSFITTAGEYYRLACWWTWSLIWRTWMQSPLPLILCYPYWLHPSMLRALLIDMLITGHCFRHLIQQSPRSLAIFELIMYWLSVYLLLDISTQCDCSNFGLKFSLGYQKIDGLRIAFLSDYFFLVSHKIDQFSLFKEIHANCHKIL